MWLAATVGRQWGDDRVLASSFCIYTNRSLYFLTVFHPSEKDGVLQWPDQVYGMTETTEKRIIWDKLELIGRVHLKELDAWCKELGPFERRPTGSTYLELYTTGNTSIAVANAQESPIAPSGALKAGVRARVHSAPYAASNPKLFHGFVTEGTVAYVGSIGDERLRDIILLDNRYLEGMVGAPVVVETRARNFSRPVGIVVGELEKTNGEGKLVLAVSLRGLKQVGRVVPDLARIVGSLCGEKAAAPSQTCPGLVAIYKRQFHHLSWGSGVLVAHDVVATNRHVVEVPGRLECWSAGKQLDVKSVIIPIEGLDLAFVLLGEPAVVPHVVLATHSPKRGTPVSTIGYGLFSPTQLEGPLFSRGIVCSVADPGDGNPTPGLLALSSGCWNGSSGGPVFDSNFRLVGIMASNAKDRETGEILPDVTFAVPIETLRQGLRLMEAGKTAESSALQTLWALQPTHVEYFRARL